MQERLLSPAIVHFSKEQMIWECITDVATEVGGRNSVNPSDRNPGFVDNSKADFMALRKRYHSGEALTKAQWYGTIEDCSSRLLTKDTDKLAAIAGAAQRFRAAGIGGPYIAGLWEDNLASELFWRPQVLRNTRSTSELAG